MNIFLQLNDKIKILSKLDVANHYQETVKLCIMPDYDIVTYGGLDDKEYPLSESHEFKDEYARIFSVDLLDYGYKVDHEDYLYRETSNDGLGRLTYKIERIDLRKREVYLKGGLYGSGFEIGGDNLDTVALLDIYGKRNSAPSDIFQDLLGEGFLLELEGNYRMSFFTYFSFIDNYINLKIDKVKPTIYTELRDSLQMLPLVEKFKVAGKYSYSTQEIRQVKLWAQLISLFKELNEYRNKIAHGTSIAVSKDLCDQCFFCAAIIFASFENNLQTFLEIKKFYDLNS